MVSNCGLYKAIINDETIRVIEIKSTYYRLGRNVTETMSVEVCDSCAESWMTKLYVKMKESQK